MSNTNNQQDISSKLRSLSNYQLRTPEYLNGLVKSSSQAVGLGTPRSTTNNQNGKKTTAATSTTQAQDDIVKRFGFLDLEPLTGDENLNGLTLEWWGVDSKIYSNSYGEEIDGAPSASHEILVDIQITSCN